MTDGGPSGVAKNMTQSHQQQQSQSQMGTKRNRVLTRQPRVKRDSDSLSSSQISPEPSTGSLEFEPFNNSSQTLYTSTTHHPMPANAHQHHQHAHHHSQAHNFLSVPSRIERHSSEPAPSLSPTSPHHLTVPQSTPFLIKQHSDPLLPSQHSEHLGGISCGTSSSSGNLTNPFAPLHRQYSHPLSGSATGAYLATSAPLQHSQHISLPESIYETASPPPAGSSQYIVPQTTPNNPAQTPSSSNSNSSATTPASSASPTKSINLPQFQSAYLSSERTVTSAAGSPPIPRVPSTQMSERSVSEDSQATVVSCNMATTATNMITSASSANTGLASKFRSSKSVSAVMQTERSSSLQTGGSTLASSSGGGSSLEHLPTLRVRSEELQRSVSSPQVCKILRFDLICISARQKKTDILKFRKKKLPSKFFLFEVPQDRNVSS